MRKEIEVKFRLGDQISSIYKYRELLESKGLKPVSRSVETDYLPDTHSNSLKSAGILFRVRSVDTFNKAKVFVTIKTRSQNDKVIDFNEIETELVNPNPKTLNLISSTIEKNSGVNIDLNLLRSNNLGQIKEALSGKGLNKVRILLDKYRETYQHGDDVVTLDFFPEQMGLYLEIESHSEEALQAVTTLIDMRKNKPVLDDYGDILKSYTRTTYGKESRFLSFSKEELSLIQKVARRGHHNE